MSDYIPRKEAEKVPWNNNLKAKVETLGAALGLSDTDITDLQDACTKSYEDIGDYGTAKKRLPIKPKQIGTKGLPMVKKKFANMLGNEK
jgi:hypothetical protein